MIEFWKQLNRTNPGKVTLFYWTYYITGITFLLQN